MANMKCQVIELNGKKTKVLMPIGSKAPSKIEGVTEEIDKKEIKKLIKKIFK